MSDDLKARLQITAVIAGIVGVIAIALVVSLRNYGECRAQGFTPFYCATSHF